MRRALVLTLLAAVPGSVFAQRGFSGAQFSGPHFSGRSAPFHSPRFNRGVGVYYLPLFDPFYADYSAAEYPAAQPPVIVVQPQAASPAPVSSPAPMQPLMIELRGDHYVQISGEGNAHAELIDEPGLNSQTLGKRPPPPAHNVILIFRDGHREEVSNYTVADGVLYASSDYYTAGAWVRKVAVSELNVPETVAANESEGAAFHLPSAANEVVVGP